MLARVTKLAQRIKRAIMCVQSAKEVLRFYDAGPAASCTMGAPSATVRSYASRPLTLDDEGEAITRRRSWPSEEDTGAPIARSRRRQIRSSLMPSRALGRL